MCGRYSLTESDPLRLRLRFGLSERAEVDEAPRFNIAPTDPVLAIRANGEGRQPGKLRWGLSPPDPTAERRTGALINARAETVAELPAFRESFRLRRCLIPADGFYEWRSAERGKQPVRITRADGELFAFAGIWAAGPEGAREPLHSCAIITCEPNALVAPVHDRMPVILPANAESAWLDQGAAEAELLGLLRPLESEELTLREVSPAVNDARAEGPQLLEPPQRLF